MATTKDGPKVTIENPFLADIISNQEDDTPRLAYADWLLEVYGDRYSARAEFLRVQCELARIPDPPPEPSVGMRSASQEQRLVALQAWKRQWQTMYYQLRRREGELFAAHGAEWFGPTGCLTPPNDRERAAGGEFRVVRRGFVESITCSWAAFAGGPCEAVGPHHGSGRTPGLHEALYWHPGQAVVCPRCRGGDRIVYCGECSGGGTVPRPCPPTAQPIKVVTLTDVLDDLPNQLDIRRILRAEDGHVFWRCDRWPTLDLQLQGNAV